MFSLLRICLNSSRCMRFMFFIIDTFTQQLFIPLLNILQKLQNFFSKKGNFHQVTSQQGQLSPNVFSQHCRLAYLSSLFVCFSKLVFNKIKFLMENILQPFFLKVHPQQGASLAGCILSRVHPQQGVFFSIYLRILYFFSATAQQFFFNFLLCILIKYILNRVLHHQHSFFHQFTSGCIFHNIFSQVHSQVQGLG